MAYELSDFCHDLSSDLKTKSLDQALEAGARNLSRLLSNPAFIADTFSDDMPNKRELYHDADTDFYVFAHLQKEGKSGAPHSHGSSWAIYGNARALTQMTEYRRVNDPQDESATLQVSDRYALYPGQTRAYGPHLIHSTAHPERAWVIRVTGTDLNALPRFRFKKERDTLIDA